MRDYTTDYGGRVVPYGTKIAIPCTQYQIFECEGEIPYVFATEKKPTKWGGYQILKVDFNMIDFYYVGKL
jgi:hypothetical protein